MLPYRTV